MAECPVNTNSMNKMAGTYRSNLTKADLIATERARGVSPAREKELLKVAE